MLIPCFRERWKGILVSLGFSMVLFFSCVMFQDAGLKTVTNAQLGCAPNIHFQRLLYPQGERR